MELTLNTLIDKLKDDTKNITADFKNIDLIIALKELSEIDGHDEFKNKLANDIFRIINTNKKMRKNIILYIKSDYNVELIESIGRIYNILFFNNYYDIKIFEKHNLISPYLGHTSVKVEEILNENLNQVVVINELQCLITNNNDTYGKEALTTIIGFLNINRDKISFIFAGDEEHFEKIIFKLFPGLKRRCAFHYEI